MIKLTRLVFITLAAFLLLACGQKPDSSVVKDEPAAETKAAEEAVTPEAEEPVQQEEVVLLPSVVLYQELKVWKRNGDQLGDSVSMFEMGDAVNSTGEESELSYRGGKPYDYTKIMTPGGEEAWIASWYLAENSIPSVIIKKAALYSRPDLGKPDVKTPPLMPGQIVSVSLETGLKNGFAQVTWSSLDGDDFKRKSPRFVRIDTLSQSKDDISAARLGLAAVINAGQSELLLKKALEKDSYLNLTFDSERMQGRSYSLWSDHDEIAAVKEGSYSMDQVRIFTGSAVSDSDNEALSWCFASSVPSDGQSAPSFGWLKVDLAELLNETRAGSISAPEIPVVKKTASPGNPAVVLYPGLSWYNNPGKDYSGSLNFGEIVALTGNTGKKEGSSTVYSELINAYGEKGWAPSYYLMENALPAVSTEEVLLYSRASETAVTGGSLPVGSIIAVYTTQENPDFTSFGWNGSDALNKVSGQIFAENAENFYSTDAALIEAAALIELARVAVTEDDDPVLAEAILEGIDILYPEGPIKLPAGFQSLRERILPR